MLGLGLGEILVVVFLLLVVVGPERLPMLFRHAGRAYAQVRRMSDELRRAFTLEADRMEAEERLGELKERRRKAEEERSRALEAAGQGAVAQDQRLTAPPAALPDEAPGE